MQKFPHDDWFAHNSINNFEGDRTLDATFRIENVVFNYRVAGVLIKDGHVLLHKQVTDTHWALPGGRVEVLEDSRTGLSREFQEELGLSIRVNNLLWVTENFFEYMDRKFHEIGFYYSTSTVNETNLKSDAFFGLEGEKLIYKWMPIADLDSIILYPEFLRTSLKELPINPQHLIIKDIGIEA